MKFSKFLKPKVNLFRKLLVSFGFVVTIVYLFQFGGSFYNSLAFVFYLIPFLLLFYSLISLIKVMGQNRQVLGYQLILAGVSSGTIGQLIWGYFHFFAPSNLINVIPPIFFFTTYVFIFFGFITVAKALSVNWKTGPELIIAFTLLGIILVTIIAKSGFHLNQDLPPIVNLINIGYIIGDIVHLIVVYLIVLIVISYRGGGLFGRYWNSLFVGHILLLLGDFSTAVFFKQYASSTWPFTMLDLIFIGAYLFNAHGYYGLFDSVRQAQSKIHTLQAKKSLASN